MFTMPMFFNQILNTVILKTENTPKKEKRIGWGNKNAFVRLKI